MARSCCPKRRLLLDALVAATFFTLSRFSTLIPCCPVPGLSPLAEVLSLTMETIPFFVLTVALAYYVYKDRSKIKDVLFEAVVLNVAVLFFKYLFNTPRPLPSLTPGYPSGHAARAFWLFFRFGEGKLRYALLAYAIAVAWSRVELCKHYPLDVVGGALLAYLVREVWRVARSP